MDPRASTGRAGVFFGLAAHVSWGFVALYFKAVDHVDPLEVLAHRILWSVPLLLLLLHARGRVGEIGRALRSPRTRSLLLMSTVLIALNWFTFIWAVDSGRVLQASLGYFINPLVNVLLGFLFLRERLRPWQGASVALAGAGVLALILGAGIVPWISLMLAISFGFYGLIRKQVAADSLVGLTTETSLLLPLAMLFLLSREQAGELAFVHAGQSTSLLLLLAGPVTAIPLLFFTAAMRRLRMATAGFLQYVGPTLQFLLAVLVFGEGFTRHHLMAFGCIWVALAIYTVDTIRGHVRPAVTPIPGTQLPPIPENDPSDARGR